jgi:regulator of cell morphogenesis and NO signaling
MTYISAFSRARKHNLRKESAMAIDESSEVPLDALLDHIERTHHAFTRAEIARLQPLLKKVLEAHGDRHRELADVAETFLALTHEVEPHMMKEEAILFPAIRAADGGGSTDFVEPPIRVMMLEHEEVTRILHELREKTKGFTAPDDACGSYRALFEGLEALEKDLIAHIQIEDESLFPRALALVD